MYNLPVRLIEPIYWFFLKAPRKTFIIFKRITVLINNETGFSLNLRLLFTPLFNDYTKAGRVISFVIRIFQIVIGGVFTVFLAIATAVSPALWFGFPIAVCWYFSLSIFYIFLYLAVLYIYRFFSTRNTPRKRLSEVKNENYIDAMRPNALRFFHQAVHRTKIPREIYKNSRVTLLLKRAELDKKEFLETLRDKKLKVEKISETAYKLAEGEKARYIEIEHLFYALVACSEDIENLLTLHSSKLSFLKESVFWLVDIREKISKMYFWQDDYEIPVMGGVGRGMTGKVTPYLDAISEDYTEMAKKGKIKEIFGHRQKIEEIANILSADKGDVLIIGPPGSGKTSIVMGIALEVIRGIKYKTLWNKRIVKIDAGSLISGSSGFGQVAGNLQKVMKDIKESKDIILFIDEIHNLSASLSGSENAEVSNLYAMLEPYISSEGVKVIGATNIENYRKYVEPNGAFARLFNVIEVAPTDKNETLEILKQNSLHLEKQHDVFITYPALNATVILSAKLIRERVDPDRSLDVLRRAITSVSTNTKRVDAKLVTKIVSQLTKVPLEAINENDSQKLLNIEDKMKERVIGQDMAISKIGKALKRARMGMRDESKPIASFLFVGTTGVGKTETAKALSRTYFGSEDTMIRLDMSEYQQLDSLNKLIGTPDGKVLGVLTEAVKKTPFTLILLDEIEKAYSSVLLTFLQVLDDGRLTDSQGQTYDFTNTIIIATSNVGTREIQESFSENLDRKKMSERALHKVREHFAPEFLNRFNDIIVFNPLTEENVKDITGLLLKRVVRMAKDKGIEITFSEDLIEELARRGYNPEWGARPLARVIEEYVETYLAIKMLAKELNRGDSVELGLEVFDEV